MSARAGSGAARVGGGVGRWLAACLLFGYAVWVALPMLWVAGSSLKGDAAIFTAPFALPGAGEEAWRWDNYARAWREARLSEYFLNSVVVTAAAVTLITVLGAMAAYALARFAAPWRRWVFGLFVVGLTLPAQLAVIPLFFQMRALGLLDSLPGLVLVYTANGLPFAVFVLAGFFRALPRELYEAAVVDGCSEAGAFWRVWLPLARPGLATVAIFQFIGVWKEYFFAFMLLNGADGGARTLPLGLANLAITAQYRGDQGPLFAGLVLTTLPILAVYLWLQRQIVAGVTAGAVKG
jgi:ABC-type glycerol-3-phosphate transport system permease component